MTKRTTDDWEALLDGTDPAPWKLQGTGRFPLSPSGLWSVDIVSRSGKGTVLNNAQLAITAPEAVAEVVRIREELEALRRACIESAEVSERKAEVAHVPDVYVGVAETGRDIADTLTRILDGSNDE